MCGKEKQIDKHWEAKFTSLVALAGVIIGVSITAYFTNSMNNELLTRQDIIKQRDSIFQKRVELIERTSTIFNSRHIITNINEELEIHSIMAKQASECAKNPQSYGSTVIGCMELINTQEAFEKQQIKNKIIVEFGAVLQMNAVYFGTETEKLSIELSKNPEWWQAKDTVFTNYISAMRNELQQF